MVNENKRIDVQHILIVCIDRICILQIVLKSQSLQYYMIVLRYLELTHGVCGTLLPS